MDPAHLVQIGFEIIGVASAIAAGLRTVLPYLRDLANRTGTDADNAVVETLSIGLQLLTMALETAHRIADAAGLNPPVSVKTAEEEKTK